MSGFVGLTIGDMTYRATAAYPYLDHDRAVSALRGALRALAAQHRVRADRSTLRVTGRDQVLGAHGRVWYEWSGTVEAATPMVDSA